MSELDLKDLKELFLFRTGDTNKGNFGYVAILGGCLNYSGAVKLANLSCSALRAGCGVSKLIAKSYIFALRAFKVSSFNNGLLISSNLSVWANISTTLLSKFLSIIFFNDTSDANASVSGFSCAINAILSLLSIWVFKYLSECFSFSIIPPWKRRLLNIPYYSLIVKFA